VDGVPVDPPSFTTVAPLWRPGDTIPLGRQDATGGRRAPGQPRRAAHSGRRGHVRM